jgi:hypothetical protein
MPINLDDLRPAYARWIAIAMASLLLSLAVASLAIGMHFWIRDFHTANGVPYAWKVVELASDFFGAVVVGLVGMRFARYAWRKWQSKFTNG